MLAKRWYQDRVDSTQRADLSGFWGNEPSLEPGTQISRDFRFPDFSVGTDSGKSGNPGIPPGKSGNQEIRRQSRPGNPEIREIQRETRKPDFRYPLCLSFSSRIAGHRNHPSCYFRRIHHIKYRNFWILDRDPRDSLESTSSNVEPCWI